MRCERLLPLVENAVRGAHAQWNNVVICSNRVVSKEKLVDISDPQSTTHLDQRDHKFNFKFFSLVSIYNIVYFH